MKLKRKTIKKLERAGFSYSKENGIHIFGKFSPYGQDFSFELNDADDIDDLARAAKKCYDNFDPSEEAYLWLDETGHGKNGAPYDMKDVYEDMEACEGFIMEVVDILEEEHQQ